VGGGREGRRVLLLLTHVSLYFSPSISPQKKGASTPRGRERRRAALPALPPSRPRLLIAEEVVGGDNEEEEDEDEEDEEEEEEEGGGAVAKSYRSFCPPSLPPYPPPSAGGNGSGSRGENEGGREGGSFSSGLDRSKEGEGIRVERRTQEEVEEKAKREKGR